MKTSDRVIAFLLAVTFLASGAAKLAGLEFEVDAFQRWGYPLWFMYATGLVEVAGGILLLVPRTSTLAAAGLSMFMIGAVGTHVLHAEWGMLVLATAIMLLAARHARRSWVQTRIGMRHLPVTGGA